MELSLQSNRFKVKHMTNFESSNGRIPNQCSLANAVTLKITHKFISKHNYTFFMEIYTYIHTYVYSYTHINYQEWRFSYTNFVYVVMYLQLNTFMNILAYTIKFLEK